MTYIKIGVKELEMSNKILKFIKRKELNKREEGYR